MGMVIRDDSRVNALSQSKIGDVIVKDPKPLGCQRRPQIRVEREQFGAPGIEGLVLYRCYGLDGTLMYIGQTCNLQQRLASHRAHMPWWFAVEHIRVQQHRNRNILKQDELRAINAERPFFNKHGYGRRQEGVASQPFGGTHAKLACCYDSTVFSTVQPRNTPEDDLIEFPQVSG